MKRILLLKKKKQQYIFLFIMGTLFKILSLSFLIYIIRYPTSNLENIIYFILFSISFIIGMTLEIKTLSVIDKINKLIKIEINKNK